MLKVANAIETDLNAPLLQNPHLETTITHEQLEKWLREVKALNSMDPNVLRAILAVENLLARLPKKTVLLPNYPNPFNPETWIPYQLAKASHVKITIYDVRGRVVRMLELGYQPAGFYMERNRAAHWDGRNTFSEQVVNGIYFYQLQTNSVSVLRKMVILK